MFIAVSQLLDSPTLVHDNQALFFLKKKKGMKPYGRYSSIDAHFEKVQPTQEPSILYLTSQCSNMLKITKLHVDNSKK
jgi:hypothetical protein